MNESQRTESLIKRVRNAFESTERRNAEQQWSTIAKYMLPGQSGSFSADGSNPSKGSKTTQAIYDSTAAQANRDLAAAIHSTLTNPATTWSKSKFKREDLNKQDEPATWIEDTTNRFHSALNDSAFDNNIAKSYLSYTSIANMALLFEEAPKNPDGTFGGFEFTALHMGEIAWSENSKGLVDTAYRRIFITARQAAERFGEENLSEKVLADLEENPDKDHQYFHLIFPRKAKEVKLVNGIGKPKELPFASIYIDPEDKRIVEEGGYYEFPILAVRWETAPGEVYGHGPGHLALPDVRSLNLTKELYFSSYALAVKPVLGVDERQLQGELKWEPAAINYMDSRDAVWEMTSTARFDVTLNGVEELKQNIQKLFFLDKLMLPPRDTHGEMTAYEVQQRVEQMQRVLGPTLGRLNAELLKPLVIRGLKIMLRAGALAPLPEALRAEGVDLDIEFVNQLARAQKAQDVLAIQGWLQDLAMVAQLGKPEVLDWYNADFTPVYTARVRGVPEGAIMDEATVQAIRQQRAQIQQQQMQLDSQMKAADIQAKNAAAGVNPNGQDQ